MITERDLKELGFEYKALWVNCEYYHKGLFKINCDDTGDDFYIISMEYGNNKIDTCKTVDQLRNKYYELSGEQLIAT